MIKIKDVVMDTGGNGVHNVTVTITQYPSGEAAVLYSDNGVTPLLGNSVLTNELGQYEFYIPNGRYTRTVSKTGATTVVDQDIIQAYDGAGVSLANGKTFAVLNSLTLAGTDGTTITLPSSSSALAGIAGAQTFTGLQTFADGITSADAVTINDTLTVTGPTSLTTLATSSNASVGGTLGVTGATTLSSLTVTGATTLNSLSFAGTFSPTSVSTGSITASGTLGVTGATTLTTLGTSGAATLNSATVTNNLSVGTTLGVTGATTLTTLSTSGAATLNSATTTGTLGVGTNLTVGGTFSVAGKSMSLGGNLTTSGAFASTFTMTGTTTVTFPTSGTLLSDASTIALTQLAQTSAATNDVITWNGTAWAPAAPTGGGGAGSFTTLAASGDVSLATNGGATTFVNIGKIATENGIRMYGRNSGNSVRIGAYGFDSAITLSLSSKSTGSIEFFTRDFNPSHKQFTISDTFNGVNYLNVTGGVTTAAPVLSSLGSDTNIDVRVTPKGTGMLSTTGIKIDEGSNKRMGITAAMTAGSIVVSTTAVTANSRIFLTAQNTGGTAGALRVSARTAGTSFTITSTSNTDTSTVAWMIMEPA